MTLERHNFKVLLDSLSDEDYHDFLDNFDTFSFSLYASNYFDLDILAQMKYEYRWLIDNQKEIIYTKVHPIYLDWCVYVNETNNLIVNFLYRNTYNTREGCINQIKDKIKQLEQVCKNSKTTIDTYTEEIQKLKQTYGIK